MGKRHFRKYKRSGTDICPICLLKSPLVEHHLDGRQKSDLTVWICAGCHDRVHMGEVIIEGVFMTSVGKELYWHNKGNPPKIAVGHSPPVYK